METLLVEMKSELKQISQALEELKVENSMLRKEILGIRNSSNTDSDNCVGLIKGETLRELVETIQFDVGKIKETIIQIERRDTTDVHLSQSQISKNKMASSAESMEEYKPVRIRSKEEEDQRRLARVYEFKLRGVVLSSGSTLTGTTLESIISSVKLSEKVKSSTVLIFSNHLPLTIKSITGSCDTGRRIRGPSEIKGHTREVFSLEGNSEKCTFAYLFKISAELSLAVSCGAQHDGWIFLDAGFTPSDISWRLSLNSALEQNAEFSAHCFSTGGDFIDVGLAGMNCSFVKGGYLAQIEMTPGPQSIVRVEIWNDRAHLLSIVERMGRFKNGESVGDVTVVDYLNGSSNGIENVTLLPVACIVEIVNGLGVSLRNSQIFMSKLKGSVSPPTQVLPFTREMFCAADESVVNGIFSYEIEDTDLKILVAFKCEDGGDNCFSITTGPLETNLNEEELENLLNPIKTWKTLESRKYAQAKEGEQVIVARNVHINASMTDGKISNLKIFLFPV